jgi:hypothetical protein
MINFEESYQRYDKMARRHRHRMINWFIIGVVVFGGYFSYEKYYDLANSPALIGGEEAVMSLAGISTGTTP